MKYIIAYLLFITLSFSNSLTLSKVEIACKKNNIPEACYELGLMYAKGFGAKKDIKKAILYYQLANKHGIKNILDSSIILDINKTLNIKIKQKKD